jgi:hypothetical protein
MLMLFTVQVPLPDVISTPYWQEPTVPLPRWPPLTSHLKIEARSVVPEVYLLVARNDHGPPGW